jgi:hypothetical protein
MMMIVQTRFDDEMKKNVIDDYKQGYSCGLARQNREIGTTH